MYSVAMYIRDEEYEVTKVVIRSHKSKDRHHYDQTKKEKNNDLQNTKKLKIELTQRYIVHKCNMI